MTQQRGVNALLNMGFETSAYGTAAVTGFRLPINTCGIVGTKTRKVPATLTGSRNTVAPFAGNKNVEGPIVIPADSLAMAYWLMAMFGNPTTTGAGPYVHEYKVGSSMPSFTFEKAFTDVAVDIYERYVGCKVSTFNMVCGGDGELICTLNVLGANMTHETSGFDADPDVISLARLNNFDAAILEGGGALANATELTINIDFGLDPNSFVIGGGGIRGDIPEGFVAVTGNLKTLLEDDSLLDKATGDTETSLKLTLTGSASSILEFEIQELLYSVNGVPVEGPQGLIVSLDFVGYYTNGSEISDIVARLTNGVSAYSYMASASVSPSVSSSQSPSASVSPSPSPS